MARGCTYIGVLLGIAWPVTLAFIGIWLAMAAMFRMSSLLRCRESGYASDPVALGARLEAVLFAALSLLLWFTHRANIGRLLAGTEPKIGAPG